MGCGCGMPNMDMAGMGAGGYGKAGGRGNEPSCNLFVTGLPMDIDEGQLRDLFANYGMVMRCKVLPHNGMPDRAALVEMGDVAQSQWIVNNLNGNTPAGMAGPIKIGYSQSKGKGSRQSPYEQPAPGNLSGLEIKLATHTNDLGNKLWVGQIPLGTTKDLMYHEFSKYGAVQDVYIRDDGKVQGRMWGFVTFVDSTGATEVLSAFATGAFAAQAMGAAQDQFQMPPPPMPEPPQPLSVRPRADNPCKLWVGGIPAGSTEMFLREEFGKVGQVTEVFLKDDGQRSGRMWGFITMADAGLAQAAIAEMNGKTLHPPQVDFHAAQQDMASMHGMHAGGFDPSLAPEAEHQAPAIAGVAPAGLAMNGDIGHVQSHMGHLAPAGGFGFGAEAQPSGLGPGPGQDAGFGVPPPPPASGFGGPGGPGLGTDGPAPVAFNDAGLNGHAPPEAAPMGPASAG